MNILAIDPSVNNIGLAWMLEDYASIVQYIEVNPESAFVYGSVKKDNAAQMLASKIRMLGLHRCNFGIIEFPNFQTSQRGKIAAQKGYTIDLAYIAGYIVGQFPGIKWHTPTPLQWKGNQPKEAIGVKFQRWTGTDYRKVSDHCYEAAMMIKWFLDIQPTTN